MTDEAPIHLSISYSNLPSLVNKISRYLNFSAWGRDLSPKPGKTFHHFRLRTMASDLEELTFPTTSHSADKTQWQPHHVHSLKHLRANVIHLWHYNTRKLFTNLNDFFEVFSMEDMLARSRRSLKCSFHSPTISSVWVSSSPPNSITTWEDPCFPFLSHRMVCQNIREASRIPPTPEF